MVFLESSIDSLNSSRTLSCSCWLVSLGAPLLSESELILAEEDYYELLDAAESALLRFLTSSSLWSFQSPAAELDFKCSIC